MADWIAESVTSTPALPMLPTLPTSSTSLLTSVARSVAFSPERFNQLASEVRELLFHLKTPAGNAAWTAYKAGYGIAYRSELNRYPSNTG